MIIGALKLMFLRQIKVVRSEFLKGLVKTNLCMLDYFVRQYQQITPHYFLKQYAISLILCTVFAYLLSNSLSIAISHPKLLVFICIWFFLNTILFPFARYYLDSLINYVITGNAFNIPLALIRHLLKGLYLAICWSFAIILAPVGIMIYLQIKLKKIDRQYY